MILLLRGMLSWDLLKISSNLKHCVEDRMERFYSLVMRDSFAKCINDHRDISHLCLQQFFRFSGYLPTFLNLLNLFDIPTIIIWYNKVGDYTLVSFSLYMIISGFPFSILWSIFMAMAKYLNPVIIVPYKILQLMLITPFLWLWIHIFGC